MSLENALEICERIGKLHKKSGRLNLYVGFCSKHFAPDIDRLRAEIAEIKSLVSDIESRVYLPACAGEPRKIIDKPGAVQYNTRE